MCNTQEIILHAKTEFKHDQQKRYIHISIFSKTVFIRKFYYEFFVMYFCIFKIIFCLPMFEQKLIKFVLLDISFEFEIKFYFFFFDFYNITFY